MIAGFLGIGNMGGALLKGYARSEGSKNTNIPIYDIDPDISARFEKTYSNIKACADIRELCGRADFIFLGVKPQTVGQVAKELSKHCKEKKIFISMAAGVTVDQLKKNFGGAGNVVRIMPNTPAAVGEAMIAICKDEKVEDEEFSEIVKVLECTGIVEEVEEYMLDCVIGVSGSSPAYTYMYIQALSEAAESEGMTPDKAKVFAAQSVLGAAKMVIESGKDTVALRKDVCSPGGTTIQAVNTLLHNGFMDNVKEGFSAAVCRSREMSRIDGEKKTK